MVALFWRKNSCLFDLLPMAVFLTRDHPSPNMACLEAPLSGMSPSPGSTIQRSQPSGHGRCGHMPQGKHVPGSVPPSSPLMFWHATLKLSPFTSSPFTIHPLLSKNRSHPRPFSPSPRSPSSSPVLPLCKVDLGAEGQHMPCYQQPALTSTSPSLLEESGEGGKQEAC